MTHPSGLPTTLGALKASAKYSSVRGVKDELRENLICKLKNHEELFPGIVGYEDTVAPQVVNAVLSKHNFILLGLRGRHRGNGGPSEAGCEVTLLHERSLPEGRWTRRRCGAHGAAQPADRGRRVDYGFVAIMLSNHL